jgi:hypothetical protein
MGNELTAESLSTLPHTSLPHTLESLDLGMRNLSDVSFLSQLTSLKNLNK